MGRNQLRPTIGWRIFDDNSYSMPYMSILRWFETDALFVSVMAPVSIMVVVSLLVPMMALRPINTAKGSISSGPNKGKDRRNVLGEVPPSSFGRQYTIQWENIVMSDQDQEAFYEDPSNRMSTEDITAAKKGNRILRAATKLAAISAEENAAKLAPLSAEKTATLAPLSADEEEATLAILAEERAATLVLAPLSPDKKAATLALLSPDKKAATLAAIPADFVIQGQKYNCNSIGEFGKYSDWRGVILVRSLSTHSNLNRIYVGSWPEFRKQCMMKLSLNLGKKPSHRRNGAVAPHGISTCGTLLHLIRAI